MAKKTGKSLPRPDKGQLALFKGGDSVAPEGEDSEVREKATSAMVRADERAILAGAEGQMAASWVYQYTQGDQTVTGISYPGFRALYQRVYKTDGLVWQKFPEVTSVPDDPRGPTLVAYGEICNPKAIKQIWPVWAEEPLMKRSRGGGTYPNYHARCVVTGKLLRNAMKLVTPDKAAGLFLAHCLKQKASIEHLSERSGESQEKAVTRESVDKTGKLHTLFQMADNNGINTKDRKQAEKFRGLIAGQFGTRLKEMNAAQVGDVVSWLEASIKKSGKDAFISAVEYATAQSS